MKLSNIAVIFIVIAIPVILLLSYYISLQVDTINMQSLYTTKQLNATREAIDAFEINTVEWNNDYGSVEDTKRRNIMASINTFNTSFANSLGIGGASKSDMLAYIPAIACTLYDGYYIYSPAEAKQVIKDEKGVAVFFTEKLWNSGKITTNFSSDDYDTYKGKLLYEAKSNPQGTYTYDDGSTKNFTFNLSDALTTYEHILKPFITYSARYCNGKTGTQKIDITVNYTLDNYITVYGIVDGKYVEKSGYLITGGSPYGETLREKIAWKWKNDNNYTCKEYDYVYAEDNTKVYFDDDNNKTFQVSSTGVRTNLEDMTGVKYKKIVNSDGSINYQSLTTSDWSSDLKRDKSAINYYRESKEFTKWVQEELGDIKVSHIQLVFDDSVSEEEKQKIKKQYERDEEIFNLENNNPEDSDSIFVKHKNEIIKQSLISNLNQAITSYSKRNTDAEYQLPIFTETDWDLVLNNVSIITFVQNIPIGLKTYNNYAIATSSSNKEYVNPNGIYLSNTSYSDGYYHMPYCSKLQYNEGLIGYRNTDFVIKSYEIEKTGGVIETKYYYKHQKIANQACYYCIVQRNLFNKNTNSAEMVLIREKYQTALARERYVSHKFLNKEYDI